MSREEAEVLVQTFYEAGAASAGDRWVRAPCPLCALNGRVDRRLSLGMNGASGGYLCFRCGAKGKLPADLWDSAELPATPPPPPPPVAVDPPGQFLPLFSGALATDPHLDPYRAYWFGRASKRPEGGLSLEVGAEMYVGAAVTRWPQGRLIVPFPDYERPGSLADPTRWRGWVGRDITGQAERPYLYGRGLKREGYLFNAPTLWSPSREPVFVVEGVLDVAACWPDAVAVLGKPLRSQVSLLRSASRPVVVALDGDAWEEGWALALTLRHQGAQAGALRLPPRVDPDELPGDLLRERARAALTARRAVPVG